MCEVVGRVGWRSDVLFEVAVERSAGQVREDRKAGEAVVVKDAGTGQGSCL